MGRPPLTERYSRDARAADTVAREVARRQLARLDRAAPVQPRQLPPSRWAHVPLADLFAELGRNHLYHRADGLLECGHEPLHASTSSRCVLIDTLIGRWWCRSCRRSGQAPTYVADVQGCSYRQACRWLVERYGAPLPRRGERHHRRMTYEAALP